MSGPTIMAPWKRRATFAKRRRLAGFGVPTEALAKLQADYLSGAIEAWNRVLQPGAATGGAASDRRFAASEWSATPASAYLAEMYLLNARTLLGMAEAVQADEKTRSRLRFAVLQWIDAASPSNYLALNPEAQKKAVETGGESLAEGMRHLWDDLQRATSRRPTRARSRSAATSRRPKAGSCSRTSCSSSSSTSRSPPRCTSGRC